MNQTPNSDGPVGSPETVELRMLNMRDLVDADDIATRLEVKVAAVQKWAMRDDFPGAVFPRAGREAPGRTRIWLWPEVVMWVGETELVFRSEVARGIKRAARAAERNANK
jgi:hypothetical protein